MRKAQISQFPSLVSVSTPDKAYRDQRFDITAIRFRFHLRICVLDGRELPAYTNLGAIRPTSH